MSTRQLVDAIAHMGNRAKMAGNLLQYARETLGGDHGFFLELEETTGSLRELASFGEVEEMLNQDMRIFAQFSADNPEEEDAVILAPKANDVKKLAARKSVRREMTHSVLLFPLYTADRCMGVIYLGHKKQSKAPFKGLEVSSVRDEGQLIGHFILLDRELQRLSLQNRAYAEELKASYGIDELVGSGQAIDRVRRSLNLVAETDIPVTLLGERGTGKWVAAEAIHNLSHRQKKPLIQLTLTDLPEGMLGSFLFGQPAGAENAPAKGRKGALRDARGGTLILQGVDLLDTDLQKKLVRAMESGLTTMEGGGEEYTVDVRFVFTSQADLHKLLEQGELTREFYLKLNSFPILFAPLRDRIEDLPELVEHYVDRATTAFGKAIGGVSSEVYDFLGTWGWEGNLDELESEIRQAVLRTPDQGMMTPSMLGKHFLSQRQPSMMDSGEGTLKQRVARIEKRMIMDALEQNNHNQSTTANQLGLSRQALINKLQRYGIETGRKYKRRLREIESQAREQESE